MNASPRKKWQIVVVARAAQSPLNPIHADRIENSVEQRGFF
jgi:hypothetical protein